MSVTTVKDRIDTIVTNVTGVNEVKDGLPRNAVPGNMPFAYIATADARVVQAGSAGDTLLLFERDYKIVLVIKPWAHGIELEVEAAAEPFFTRIYDVLWGNPGLHTFTAGVPNNDPLDYVFDTALTGDSGVVNIVVGGLAVVGVVFSLTVQEMTDQPGGA